MRRTRNAQDNLNQTAEVDQQTYKKAADLGRQISRRWKEGDVYAPHDLSEVEMSKWKKRTRPVYDVLDVLAMNPLDHYRVRLSLIKKSETRQTARSTLIVVQ